MTCDDVCLLVACRTMMIGANKDGWWDEVKLMHQSEDLLDFLEAWDTDKEYQFVGHFDQSVAHNKKNADALVCLFFHFYIHEHTRSHTHTHTHAPQVATNIGMSWGGKQAKLRESTVLPDSLGDSKPKMYFIPGKGRGEWKDGPKWVDGPCRGAVEKDMSYTSGDKISHVFGENDPPPWYDLNAPRFARPRTAEEIEKETRRRKKARDQFLKKKQLTDPLAVLTPQEEERFQTTDTSKYPPIPGMSVCWGR